MMEEIDKFVYDANSQENHVFEVSSLPLRQALKKRVTEVYISTGVFAEIDTQCPSVFIKKARSFKQVNFLRGAKIRSAKQDEMSSKVLNFNQGSLGFCEDNLKIPPKLSAKSPVKE